MVEKETPLPIPQTRKDCEFALGSWQRLQVLYPDDGYVKRMVTELEHKLVSLKPQRAPIRKARLTLIARRATGNKLFTKKQIAEFISGGRDWAKDTLFDVETSGDETRWIPQDAAGDMAIGLVGDKKKVPGSEFGTFAYEIAADYIYEGMMLEYKRWRMRQRQHRSRARRKEKGGQT